jgi:CBS-domain-containing membrane protein
VARDAKVIGSDRTQQVAEAPMHTEQRIETAEELGIILPTPTAKPAAAALGIVIMLGGLMLSRMGWSVALPVLLGGAAVMIVALYSWLLSPLEPEHGDMKPSA